MTDKPAAPEIPFVDDLHAAEMFADAMSGLFNFNGNLRMTLEATRVTHRANPAELNRVVIGRLVMPVGAAEKMARAILDFVEQQRRQTEPAPQSTASH